MHVLTREKVDMIALLRKQEFVHTTNKRGYVCPTERKKE